MKEDTARSRDIAIARLRGKKYHEIGELYSITGVRCQQIFKRVMRRMKFPEEMSKTEKILRLAYYGKEQA